MDEIARLLTDQDGVIARRQALTTGLGAAQVTRLLRRGDWVLVHPGVYAEHNCPLGWQQRSWAAVLALWPAGLSHDSAMRAAEGPGRRDRDTSVLHVAVGRDRRVTAPDGVRLHRVARLEERVQWHLGPPRLRYDDAVLEVAADAVGDLEAVAVLADACGARRTTAIRLLAALDDKPWSHRRPWLRSVLTDVAGGTCSVLEHGYLDLVERPHGLPQGRRQAPVGGGGRAMFRDVEYDETGLVVELDGRLFHGSAKARDRDLERDLDAAVGRQETLRIGYAQVFERGCATAVKVGQVLQRRGWAGAPVGCERCGG